MSEKIINFPGPAQSLGGSLTLTLTERLALRLLTDQYAALRRTSDELNAQRVQLLTELIQGHGLPDGAQVTVHDFNTGAASWHVFAAPPADVRIAESNDTDAE